MLKKLLRNFGIRAFEILGFNAYVVLLQSFMRSIFQILKHKTLAHLDNLFSKKLPRIHLTKLEKSYVVDLAVIDDIANEESSTFGLVREIFINNCYFEGFEDLDISTLKTVVDLGGNRGIFTVLASGFAHKIVYVEVQDKYQNAVRHLISSNNYQGTLNIVNKYIGGVGSFSKLASDFISMDSLIESNEIDKIDFLKVDIEGAEFALFENPEWLSKVRYVALELHPSFGEVAEIIKTFKNFNFKTKLTNMDFEEIERSQNNDLLYLYAKNNNL